MELIQAWKMGLFNWILGIVFTGTITGGKIKDMFSDISKYGALKIRSC